MGVHFERGAAAPPTSAAQVAETKRKPAGGFVLISVMRLAMVWWAFKAKLLRVSDLRVYFACHLAVAARCKQPLDREPRFTQKELTRMTGAGERSVRSSLRRLEASGLLSWSESHIGFASSPDVLPLSDLSGFWAMFERLPNRKRLVPVPRRILRLMASVGTSSLIATILGHLIRCLYYWPDEGCRSHGSCKSSWIASVFGISLRGAKSARKELLDLGFLVRKESPQWRLNRLGLQLEINLAWEGTSSPAAKRPADVGREVAPPPAPSCTAFAPPESDKELSYGESKNQKPTSGGPPAAEKQSGDCISNEGRGEAPPTLRNVVPEDLRDTGRLLELHREAVEAKLVSGSERDRLLFVAAAEHARSTGKANPCGLFVHLVRGKLWPYITAEDEDRANTRLKAHLFGKPRESEKRELPRSSPISTPLSADARLVQAVRSAAAQARYRGDAFPLLKRERPEWTRERWDAAVRELSPSIGRGGTDGRSCGGFSLAGTFLPAATWSQNDASEASN